MELYPPHKSTWSPISSSKLLFLGSFLELCLRISLFLLSGLLFFFEFSAILTWLAGRIGPNINEKLWCFLTPGNHGLLAKISRMKSRRTRVKCWFPEMTCSLVSSLKKQNLILSIIKTTACNRRGENYGYKVLGRKKYLLKVFCNMVTPFIEFFLHTLW